jgi:hypothetical protein
VPSVPGGKSELFAPQLNELFVAISPHYNTPPAGAVLWYKVEPATSQLASH